MIASGYHPAAIGKYTESSAHSEFLARHQGRPLHFHAHSRLRPEPAHFTWHARHHRIDHLHD